MNGSDIKYEILNCSTFFHIRNERSRGVEWCGPPGIIIKNIIKFCIQFRISIIP